MTNKENKNTDADFLQSLISEAQEEGEVKEILIDIKDILPILRQYNEDLKVGQNNIINERLGIERMIHWYELLFKKLFDKYNELNRKVDTINNHIDRVIEDAPNKLVVSVRVSEADYQVRQSMFDQHIQKMNDLHKQQMQEMIDLHAKQMEELNNRLESDRSQQYDLGNRLHAEINRMLKDSEGFYVRGFWCWVHNIFFWIGVVIVCTYISIRFFK